MDIKKPLAGTYNKAWQPYLDRVEEGDLLLLLADQERRVVDRLRSLTDEQGLYRYGEGKWSLKELLGHIIDTERIMSYRLLCAARGDLTPLPRHPEVYVNLTNFDRRPLSDLIAEFRAVRASTYALVNGLTETELGQSAVVNDVRTTAAAIVYFMLGHAQHHIEVAERLYFPLES
ncbi:DinB family protein [Paenibacillus silvisoli]|uniref:DinB family protein n=1 Tax=Paenibacillus silvisoli TaxID=3110539 RepID=UPI0028064E7D|nr:DinB family protein [Paenibacillus silvisoli]